MIARGAVRQKGYGPGSLVRVEGVYGGYGLPAGLPEGAAVTVLGSNAGYVEVDYQGQRHTVFMACVDSGWDAQREDGAWVHHRHPGEPLATPAPPTR